MRYFNGGIIENCIGEWFGSLLVCLCLTGTSDQRPLPGYGPQAPLLTSNGKDDEDVALRIRKASGMSGSLQACLFKQKGFSNETKVAVYNSLVLSVLLYGSESWALTQRLRDKLRSFHRRCVRSMCRVNMWHVQEYHITAQALEQRLGISSFETYLVRRRLRWLGHVRSCMCGACLGIACLANF